MAAHLADKPAARLQCPIYAGEDRLGRPHPMQCRIREHRIEFAVERQVLSGHHAGVEAARLGRGDHVGGGVDRHDRGAGGGDLFGQHPVAAAEIEDMLARLQAPAIPAPGRRAWARNAQPRHSAPPTNAAANFVPCSDLHDAVVTHPAAASAANRQQKVEHHLPPSFPPPRVARNFPGARGTRRALRRAKPGQNRCRAHHDSAAPIRRYAPRTARQNASSH